MFPTTNLYQALEINDSEPPEIKFEKNYTKLTKLTKHAKYNDKKIDLSIDEDTKKSIVNSLNLMEALEEEEVEKSLQKADVESEDEEIIEPLPVLPRPIYTFVKEEKPEKNKEEKRKEEKRKEEKKSQKDIKLEKKMEDIKNKIRVDVKNSKIRVKLVEKEYVREMDAKLDWFQNIYNVLPSYVFHYINRKLDSPDSCVLYDGIRFYKQEEKEVPAACQQKIEMARVDMLLAGSMALSEFCNGKFATKEVVLPTIENTVGYIRNMFYNRVFTRSKGYRICKNLEKCTLLETCPFAHTKEEFRPLKCKFNSKCTHRCCTYLHDLESIDTLLIRYKKVMGYSFPKAIPKGAPQGPPAISKSAPWGVPVKTSQESKTPLKPWGVISKISVKFRDILYQENNKDWRGAPKPETVKPKSPVQYKEPPPIDIPTPLKNKFCSAEVAGKCCRVKCNWAHHYKEMSLCRYDGECRMKSNICIFKHTGENAIEYITRVGRVDIPLRMLVDNHPPAAPKAEPPSLPPLDPKRPLPLPPLEQPEAASSSRPKAYKMKFCHYHLAKKCNKAGKCNWAHYVDEIPFCKFDNKCTNKIKCGFRHSSENEYDFARRLGVGGEAVIRKSPPEDIINMGVIKITSNMNIFKMHEQGKLLGKIIKF